MGREDFMRLPGAWDVRHWISIPALGHEADGNAIAAALGKLQGMRRVRAYVGRKRIRVLYDQTKLDFYLIKDQLEQVGFPMADSWWWRQKENWFQYLDTNARDNANAPPPVCCSNPKGLDRSTRRQPPNNTL